MARERTRAVCDGLRAAISAYGVPVQILTDNGKVFTGRFNHPPVFAPRQAHRLAVYGQVDVAHGRAFLDLAGRAAVWAQPINDGLLDHQLNIRADAPVGQHADVFEPDQGFNDLTRLTTNEGALEFDGHTSKTEAPSFPTTSRHADLKTAPNPAGIRRAVLTSVDVCHSISADA
jgi:hypothetical protein